jgi:hypothetical protein
MNQRQLPFAAGACPAQLDRASGAEATPHRTKYWFRI